MTTPSDILGKQTVREKNQRRKELTAARKRPTWEETCAHVRDRLGVQMSRTTCQKIERQALEKIRAVLIRSMHSGESAC